MGFPLTEMVWDLNARYTGDPRSFEQGGRLNPAPPGYWIDLTELASRYGWERQPSLSDWRTYYPALQFNQFVITGGLDWHAAMAEIYPPEALTTTTPAPTLSRPPVKCPKHLSRRLRLRPPSRPFQTAVPPGLRSRRRCHENSSGLPQRHSLPDFHPHAFSLRRCHHTQTGGPPAPSTQAGANSANLPEQTSALISAQAPSDKQQPSPSVPDEAPLRFTLPTPGPAPQSLWRPPLYETPWALSPYDHFYFSRPIAADEVNWPEADYRYGGIFFSSDIVHTGMTSPPPSHAGLSCRGWARNLGWLRVVCGHERT